jgi:hypothetical protein
MFLMNNPAFGYFQQNIDKDSVKIEAPSEKSSEDSRKFNSLPRSKRNKLKNASFKSERFLKEGGCEDEVDDSDSARSSTNSSIFNNLSHKNSSGPNTEPGVISSGSSSENSSVHDIQSIRASSEKSDIMEESEDEYEKNEKDPAEIERQKTVLVGTKKFNMDPKKGIEFFYSKGILENTPYDVARVSPVNEIYII